MTTYSESFLEEIKSKLRLSEVVGSYIRLKRQGSTEDYKACCPFHHEKTPSFLVHDDKGFYKCFGCQKSGNMFSFVMDMEHITFPEAVEELAKRAHVEIKEETPQEKALYSKQKAIGEIYNRLIKSYHSILLNDKTATKAREYITKRGIKAETAEKFMLGFAFDDPKWLYDVLKSNNYSDEIIKESGLFSKNYDKLPLFRNRVLFPIRNWQGNCVGFSGRDLSGESKAKYINTPETSIYSKRNLLFGFYESLPELKAKEEIILCEGNFDVISLHQAGIGNACAPLGTAFTDEQAKLIKRYCKKVTLLFDSDSAGQNATNKAILICQKNDLECFVVKPLENSKDASQMLEENGAEALKKAVLNTEGAFVYLVHSARKLYDTRTPKGVLSVFKEVSPYLDLTSSEIERQGYIKYLSEVLHVSEEEILSDYRKLRNNKTAQDIEAPSVKQDAVPLKITADLNALLLVMNNRQYFDYFRNKVRINTLNDENARILYTVLEDCEREGNSSEDSILQMIDDESLRNLVFSSFSENLHNPSNVKDAIDETVRSIKLRNLLDKRMNIISLINSGDMENYGPEEYRGLLEAKENLDREIEELKKTEETPF